MAETETNPLPEQFLAAPGLGGQGFDLLRQQVMSRLREEGSEVGTPSTVDLMMMERASYIYSLLRFREAGSDNGAGFDTDRNYQSMMELLIRMLDKMKTSKTEEQIASEIREATVMEVVKAVREATVDLPPQLRRVVQDKLVELVS